MTRRPIISAGVTLGIGMGGFVDGILLHQIFQTHSMLSARIPKDTLANYSINMVWDGLFHAFTWIMTGIGIFLLWRAGKRDDVLWSGKAFIGALLAGWGLFNLVEGILNHHILHLHHVYEAHGISVWDYVFLGSGVLFLVAGALLIARAGRPPVEAAA